MQRVGRRGLEIKVCVELASIVVERMNQQSASSDKVSCLDGAHDRIPQKVLPEAKSLVLAVHGQSGQQNRRHWLRHVATHLARRVAMPD